MSDLTDFRQHLAGKGRAWRWNDATLARALARARARRVSSSAPRA
jgi:hypothetical protein